jgi:hypothetical protein
MGFMRLGTYPKVSAALPQSPFLFFQEKSGLETYAFHLDSHVLYSSET